MTDDQLSLFEQGIAPRSSSSEQSGRLPDGNRQGGDGEGSDDGRVKPLPRTQISELPGETFEDIFHRTADRLAEWHERADPGRERIGRFHSAGGDTERQSAMRNLPRKGTQREAVLEALRANPAGVTDYELWSVHGIGARPHVPATRREELIADGWPITDSGRRRKTDTGSPAIVWVYEHVFACVVDESAGMREGV